MSTFLFSCDSFQLAQLCVCSDNNIMSCFRHSSWLRFLATEDKEKVLLKG